MAKRKLFEVEDPSLQLSLFDAPQENQEPSVLEFIKTRFENGPDMTPEEYKRWIKILVENSFRKSK